MGERNIFFIDNDENRIKFMSSISDKDKYYIWSYKNCKQIYDKIFNGLEKIDMIIIDYNMLEIGGFDLLKLIDESKLEIPVLLLTPFTNKKIYFDNLKIKVHDCLEKPLDKYSVINKIEKILKKNRIYFQL